MTIKRTWRDDPGLIFETEYKKKFAWIPVTCENGYRLWWKSYYKQYNNWGHAYSVNAKDKGYLLDYHQDFIANITEEEYLIRKLADTL